MIDFYHRTDSAGSITRDGFRDSTIHIGGVECTGVWLSDKPLDGNEGAKGDQLLIVSFPASDEPVFDQWEIVEDRKGYREWCVPAQFIADRAHTVVAPMELW